MDPIGLNGLGHDRSVNVTPALFGNLSNYLIYCSMEMCILTSSKFYIHFNCCIFVLFITCVIL